MSLELPVTYLQSLPLAQLPFSTAGLPSQTTGVSQIPLTVTSVAHVFLVFENNNDDNNNNSHNNNNNSSGARRKRVVLVVDPIASYTHELDVAVGRCVAASSVTALRFQDEKSLFSLRTAMHPLDILVSHSSPADCIRVLPSLIGWYRATNNVVAAHDNVHGWKPVLPRVGQQPTLPATFRLQHEIPGDSVWFVSAFFPLDPPDDPETLALTYHAIGQNVTPLRERQHQQQQQSDMPLYESSVARAARAGKPPLADSSKILAGLTPPPPNGSFLSSSSTPLGGFNNGGRIETPAQQHQNEIGWMLPHAKRDGGASERAAASLLVLERQKSEMAMTQLDAVRASLDAERAALKSERHAHEVERAALQKRVKELDTEVRTMRIERVATADSVSQLQSALHQTTETLRTRPTADPSSDVLYPEPLMVSRPESIGPIATALQNAGPSDAEVLAALMLNQSLRSSAAAAAAGATVGKRATNNNSSSFISGAAVTTTPRPQMRNTGFSAASASPLNDLVASTHAAQQAARTVMIGQRGPSPKRGHRGVPTAAAAAAGANNNNSVSATAAGFVDDIPPPPYPPGDENTYNYNSARAAAAGGKLNNTSATSVAAATSSNINNRPPPSPLVVDTELPEPLEKPAWKHILGTPVDDALDRVPLDPNANIPKLGSDSLDHTVLVRSLLVKNSMPSPIQRMPAAAGVGTGSGFNSREATPTRDQPQGASRRATGGVESAASRAGSQPLSYSRHREAAPLPSVKVTETTARLHKLSDTLKAGRRLIDDLRT